MIICDVVVIKTIFKPEHQKSFRAIPERVCEVFPKNQGIKNTLSKINFLLLHVEDPTFIYLTVNKNFFFGVIKCGAIQIQKEIVKKS